MTHLIDIDDMNDKINCLIGYCECFVKLFSYLKVHWIKVPDELPNVIEEASSWIDNLPTHEDRVKQLIENKCKEYFELHVKNNINEEQQIRWLQLQELLNELYPTNS